MLYSYERMQRFVLGGYSWETDPQPPAPAAALSPLAQKFVNSYSQPRRIGKPVTKIVTLVVEAPAA